LDEKSKELSPKANISLLCLRAESGSSDQIAKARALGSVSAKKKAAKISRLFQEKI